MPDITHTPSSGGSAYAGCTAMWVVIQYCGDTNGGPRKSHALVADHDVTLRLQLAGYIFPRFHGRVTPDGHLEEIVTDKLLDAQLHEWARITL